MRLLVVIGFSALFAAGALSSPVEWPVIEGGNGHFYERIETTDATTWEEAKVLAEQLVFSGRRGHLMTIISPEENQFGYSIGGTQGGWAGGFQPFGSPEPNGSWAWITGEPWVYSGFGGPEPNDCCSAATNEENYLRVWFVGGGWNDSSGESEGPDSYMVEYEYSDCMINSVTPAFPWSIGDQVEIHGTGFIEGSILTIGGIEAVPFTRVSNELVLATVPQIEDGNHILEVSIPGQYSCEFGTEAVPSEKLDWGSLKAIYR